LAVALNTGYAAWALLSRGGVQTAKSGHQYSEDK